MVRNCDCTHAFQDERYGKGRRVHNDFVKNSVKGHRCTVCNKDKTSDKEKK